MLYQYIRWIAFVFVIVFVIGAASFATVVN